MPALAIWAAVQRFGAGALAFLGKLNPYQLAILALGILLLVQHVGRIIDHRHEARLQTQLTQCTAARHADLEAYTEAQADAQAANKAQVTKVEQQYQRNSDNERQAYLSDRAKLIAYYDGLRAKAAQGSPRSTAPSPNRAAPGGADGNGLPLSAGDDLQTREDAAEIELRLLHLQQYVTGLLAINPNSPPQAPQQP